MHALIVALTAPLMLGACGLRGPLYLPEDKPQVAGEGALPAPAATGGKSDVSVPQPAPQAQKRDRATQSTEQVAPQPAN
ncbi:MAG: lipoprotein [Steroidobacteraceae bacterium]